MTEKVRDKNGKCLAIANDEGAHEAEALSALTMARRLMAAHKIGAHEIDL